MGKAIRFLSGFAVGVCAGAAAGLLLAPGAGDELRYTLAGRLQAIVEEGQLAAYQRRAELQQEFANARRLRPLPPSQA